MITKDTTVAPENIVGTGITLGKPLLQLQLGHATAAVPGKNNEDFHGIVTPREEKEAQTRGIAVAIADGVWEVLGERVVREVMQGGGSSQAIAETLVERSIKNQVQYMGRNDATAIVIAVEEYAVGE